MLWAAGMDCVGEHVMLTRRNVLCALGAAALPLSRPAKADTAADFAIGLGMQIRILASGIPARPFKIPSSSMAPTIVAGDVILVDPRSPQIPVGYGHVLLFQAREPDLYFCKRLLGRPGDRIAFQNHRLIFNGAPANWIAEGEGSIGSDPSFQTKVLYFRESVPGFRDYRIAVSADRGTWDKVVANMAEIVVPPGQLFFVGDYRTNSADSRYSVEKPVTPRQVLGRPIYRVRPNPGWLVDKASVPNAPDE